MVEKDQPIDVLTGKAIPSFGANFRAYPLEQLAHAASGWGGFFFAIAGWALLHPACALAILLIPLVCFRQRSEFDKRRDTIGHDMAWVVIGAWAGIILAMAVIAMVKVLL